MWGPPGSSIEMDFTTYKGSPNATAILEFIGRAINDASNDLIISDLYSAVQSEFVGLGYTAMEKTVSRYTLSQLWRSCDLSHYALLQDYYIACDLKSTKNVVNVSTALDKLIKEGKLCSLFQAFYRNYKCASFSS